MTISLQNMEKKCLSEFGDRVKLHFDIEIENGDEIELTGAEDF